VYKTDQAKIENKNILSELDDDFIPKNYKIMSNEISGLVSNDNSISIGLEDIRMFVYRNEIWFIATNVNYSPIHNINTMILGKYNTETYEFIDCRVIHSPTGGYEKNWIPIVSGDNLFFIYKWSPYEIGRINLQTNKLEIIVQETIADSIFQKIRGSSIFVPEPSFHGNLIGVVHFSEGHKIRQYYHLLVILDKNTFLPILYSDVFYFEKIGVEFCIGFTPSEDTYHFWISRNDKDPLNISVSKDAIRKWQPIMYNEKPVSQSNEIVKTVLIDICDSITEYDYPTIGPLLKPMNTCHIYYKNKHYINTRYSTYIRGIIDFVGIIENKNMFSEISNENLKPLYYQIMTEENLSLKRNIGSYTCGLEDIRLFEFKNELWYIATNVNYSPIYNVNSMILGKYLEKDGMFQYSDLDSRVILSPDNACEKNWIPIVSGGGGGDSLQFIYKWYPEYEIGEVRDDRLVITKKTTIVNEIFKGVRGSSVFVPNKNGDLVGVVHFSHGDRFRTYYHFLVILDKDTFLPKYHSDVFIFEKLTVEFCIGFAIIHDKYQFWISRDNRDPLLITVNEDKIPIHEPVQLNEQPHVSELSIQQSIPYTKTTFVSSLLNIYNKPYDHKDIAWRLNRFEEIACTGIPIVVYISACFEEDIRRFMQTYVNIKIGKIIELEETFCYNMYKEIGGELPQYRNMGKDTPEYMSLMNSKIEFMMDAMEQKLWGESSHYAWIDFNISYVFQDKEKSGHYLKWLSEQTLVKGKLIIPGCYGKLQQCELLLDNIYYRFCGGFFIGDIDSITRFWNAYKEKYGDFLKETGKILWEVNFWAWLEYKGYLDNLHWMSSDHNDEMVKVSEECIVL
jgi:hypothetical protein